MTVITARMPVYNECNEKRMQDSLTSLEKPKAPAETAGAFIRLRFFTAC